MPSTPPDLTTRLTPTLELASPLLAASGTFGYGDELADLTDGRALGALIAPTLTPQPRPGNAMPRTVEASASLLHATGLPNPGLQAFLTDRLPQMNALPCPIIVSILAETEGEWRQLAADLTAAGGVAALELNLTPLTFLTGEHAGETPPSEAAQLERIAAAVGAVRAATMLPLIAKLPPIGVEVGRAAQVAVETGADVIAVSQAFPGVAVRLSRRRFTLPGVVGGLSGPCIKPLALYQVWRVAQEVKVPILGGGGIMNGEDALEFLMAGASAVTVGVANAIHPDVITRIRTDLLAYMATHSLSRIS